MFMPSGVAALGEIVTLSGTLVAPNTSVSVQPAPGSAAAQWEWRLDGTLWQLQTGNDQQFRPGVEWCSRAPIRDYWLRLTLESGDTPNVGDQLDTWYDISAAADGPVAIGWSTTTGTRDGIVRAEIALDALGAEIIETGYYEGRATVTP